jgi:hypothetical protein
MQRNCSYKTIAEIEEKLKAFDLSLGMKFCDRVQEKKPESKIES